MTGIVVSFCVGLTGGYMVALAMGKSRMATAAREASRRAQRARREIDRLGERMATERLQLEERERQRSGRFLRIETRQITSRRSAVGQQVRFLDQQVAHFEMQEAELSERDRQLADRQREVERLAARLERRRSQTRARLSERYGEAMASRIQEFRKGVLQGVLDEIDRVRLRELDALAEDADRHARRIIGVAVGRCQVSHDHPLPSSLIRLVRDGQAVEIPPSFDLRGLFEQLLNVNLKHDAEQQTLFISHPDGVVREVARRTLEYLLDHELFDEIGVEALVARYQQEVRDELRQLGREVLEELGLADVDQELCEPFGRLRFRTSFGQNILYHSIEVGFLCAAIGGEVGMDATLALRAGLFHDIGKVLDHVADEGHPELGARLLAEHGEPPEVVEAARDHHQPPEKQPPYAALVCAADAISAARPGARRESFDQYVKRLERLEMIASSFLGVETAYAIQAGRELRVLVDPDEVDDKKARDLCAGIAQQVQQELEFPGRVKVTLIREKRIVEYAR